MGILAGVEPQAESENALLWNDKPHVFVAGGLGYVGRNLIPELISAGFGVRSMALTFGERAQLRGLGCSNVWPGEPYSLEAVKMAARNCVFAVHCATCFLHFDPSADDIIFRANALITSNIIQACKALGIKKLVVQSSEAAMFDGESLVNVNEERPLPSNPIGSYARSMQEVERQTIAANGRWLETVVVRPRLLWGRDDEYFLPPLVESAVSGSMRLIGQGQYLTSTCHVANACEGIICALRCAPGGETYFLTDGSPIKFSTFVRSLLCAKQVLTVEDLDSIMTRSMPLWLANRLAKLCERICSTIGGHATITRSGIGLVGQEMTMCDSKARADIGYKGSISIERGVAEIQDRAVRALVWNTLGIETRNEQASLGRYDGRL